MFDRIEAENKDGWLEYPSNESQLLFENAPILSHKDVARTGVNAFFWTLSQIGRDIEEDVEVMRGRRLPGSGPVHARGRGVPGVCANI